VNQTTWQKASEWPLTISALAFLAAYAIPIIKTDLPSRPLKPLRGLLAIVDRADRRLGGLARSRFMLLVATGTFVDSANDDSGDGRPRKKHRADTYG